jgi:ribose transport system substrate-binding protein
MTKRSRRILLLGVLVLIFCLSSMVLASNKATVVSTFITLDNDYYKGWDRGAREAAEALGLDYTGIVTNGDANKELAAIESSLAGGTKIFACSPVGEQIVPTLARLLNENGGKLAITWEIPKWYTPLDGGDGFTAYMRPEIEKESYELATVLFKHLGGKGTVIHITGRPGNTADTLVTHGVNRAAKEFPKIKVVGQLPGNYNRVDSQKVMEDLMTAYPTFDAVFGQNDAVAIGALKAIENAKKPLVPIVGEDGTTEALDLIKEGKMFATVSAFPEWQAGYSVVRAFDAANGYKPSIAERMMLTGYKIITKENVDQYINSIGKSKKLPYNWKLMSRALNPKTWDPQNLLIPADPTTLWDPSDKPKGYELPKEYVKAVNSGELKKVEKEYRDHYKKKLF